MNFPGDSEQQTTTSVDDGDSQVTDLYRDGQDPQFAMTREQAADDTKEQKQEQDTSVEARAQLSAADHGDEGGQQTAAVLKIVAGFHGMMTRRQSLATAVLLTERQTADALDRQPGPDEDSDTTEGKTDPRVEVVVVGKELEQRAEDVKREEMENEEREPEDKSIFRLEDSEAGDQQEDGDDVRHGTDAKETAAVEEPQECGTEDVEQKTEKEQEQSGEEVEKEDEDQEVIGQQEDEDKQTKVAAGEKNAAAAATVEEQKDQEEDGVDNCEESRAGGGLKDEEDTQDREDEETTRDEAHA